MPNHLRLQIPLRHSQSIFRQNYSSYQTMLKVRFFLYVKLYCFVLVKSILCISLFFSRFWKWLANGFYSGELGSFFSDSWSHIQYWQIRLSILTNRFINASQKGEKMIINMWVPLYRSLTFTILLMTCSPLIGQLLLKKKQAIFVYAK